MQANLIVSTIPSPPRMEVGKQVLFVFILPEPGRVLPTNVIPTFLGPFVPGAEDTKMNERRKS